MKVVDEQSETTGGMELGGYGAWGYRKESEELREEAGYSNEEVMPGVFAWNWTPISVNDEMESI